MLSDDYNKNLNRKHMKNILQKIVLMIISMSFSMSLSAHIQLTLVRQFKDGQKKLLFYTPGKDVGIPVAGSQITLLKQSPNGCFIEVPWSEDSLMEVKYHNKTFVGQIVYNPNCYQGVLYGFYGLIVIILIGICFRSYKKKTMQNASVPV